MGKLKLAISNIEALSDAQKSHLVRTGIIVVENTDAEEQLWNVVIKLVPRTQIATIIGLHITTFNTYINDPYRLVLMKEQLFTKLAHKVSERDVTYVTNVCKRIKQVAEEVNG